MNTLMDSLLIITTWIFTASIKTTFVVIITFISRTVLRESLTARWLHAFWLMVILRLILPVEVQSPLSVFNVIRDIGNHASLVQTQNTTVPIGQNNELVAESKTIVTDASVLKQVTSAALPKVNSAQSYSCAEILSFIWVIGALFTIIFIAKANLKLWRQLRRASALRDAKLLYILAKCQRVFRITKNVTIYSAPNIVSPMMCGLLNPHILLPLHMTETLSDTQLKHILLHELAHYKRGDLLVAWLCTALQALHWFNPLLWLAFFHMRSDCEAACDETVLSRLGEHHSEAYGSTIISLLRHQSQRQLLPITIGLSDNRSNLKRRILMIRNFSKKSMWWHVAAVVVMMSVAAVALTGTVALKNEPITIKLGEYGQIEINGVSVDSKNVASILKNEYVLDKATVIVETSVETNAASIVELAGQLVNAGITQVSFLNRESGKSYPAQFTIQDRPVPSSNRNIKYFQQNSKWGYADDQGNVVVPPTFDEVYPTFINGLATVKLNGTWGMIDTLGTVVVPIQYDKLGHLEDERILFQEKDKWGFLDANGVVVIPAQYENAKFFFNNVAPVQLDSLWGFINKNGDMVIQPQFEDIQGFMEGLAPVQLNGRWGFVDAQDNMKIAPQYEQVNPFTSGLASVKIKGKWGFIDKDNNIVIEPQFNNADFFYDSRAAVQVGNKYGVIDQSGTMMIEPEFDMIANYYMGVCFAVIFENKEKGIAAQQVHFDLAGNKLR